MNKNEALESITNKCKANETKESIINLMNKYNLVVLPVLNNKNELIGRITIDDVLSTFKERPEILPRPAKSPSILGRTFHMLRCTRAASSA